MCSSYLAKDIAIHCQFHAKHLSLTQVLFLREIQGTTSYSQCLEVFLCYLSKRHMIYRLLFQLPVHFVLLSQKSKTTVAMSVFLMTDVFIVL